MRGRSRFSERARSISSFFVQGHRPRQPRGAAADPRAGAARFETGRPVLVLVAQRPRPRRRSRAGRSSWTALTGFNSCSISWTRPNRCANSPGRDRGDARSRSLGRGAGGKRRGDKPLGARPLSRPKTAGCRGLQRCGNCVGSLLLHAIKVRPGADKERLARGGGRGHAAGFELAFTQHFELPPGGERGDFALLVARVDAAIGVDG